MQRSIICGNCAAEFPSATGKVQATWTCPKCGHLKKFGGNRDEPVLSGWPLFLCIVGLIILLAIAAWGATGFRLPE